MTEQEKSEIIKYAGIGHMDAIGFQMIEVEEGYSKGELPIMPEHHNPIGSVHGGVIFSIADTVGGVAALTRGSFLTTVSGGINYLNPAINCKKLIGEGREIKTGKKIGVYEVKISDETGRLIAVATMTYYYMK